MASDLLRCRNKKCCDRTERVRRKADRTYMTYRTDMTERYERGNGTYSAARKLSGAAFL
jgi:hypothetical protein